MERLQWSLGFRHGICVDGKGKGGGLALWWRDGVDVSVRPWCQYYIDAKITTEHGTWRFSGIYGEPRTELINSLLKMNNLGRMKEARGRWTALGTV
jgi:hypothetical protein